jgi:hypothetical protein
MIDIWYRQMIAPTTFKMILIKYLGRENTLQYVTCQVISKENKWLF